MAEGQSDQDHQAAFRDSIGRIANSGITTAELADAKAMLARRSGGSRTPPPKAQPPARGPK